MNFATMINAGRGVLGFQTKNSRRLGASAFVVFPRMALFRSRFADLLGLTARENGR